MLVLVVGAGIVAATTRWSPVSDWALLELQVRQVGGAHTPLTGSYSRFGWDHPGPWPIWLLAVPYRLLGSSSVGLLVGAVAFKGAAVVGIARVTWRRGGLGLTLLALAAMALLLRSVGVGVLLDPWNPWLAAPAFAWFTFLAWDLACGHRWSLPVAVAVGSLAVQAHLGVGVLVATLGLTALVLVRLGPGRRLEAPTGPTWSRAILVTGVAAAVLWAPVAIQQVTAERGNVADIGSFFFGHGSEGATTFFGDPAQPTGWHEGLSVLARETVGWAPWLGGPEPRTILGAVDGRSPWALAVPVALALATGLLGLRLRRPELWAAAVLSGAGLVAAAYSVSRVLGQPFDYLVRWTWPTAMFLSVTAAWAVALAVRALRPASARTPALRLTPWVAWPAVLVLLAVSTTSLAGGLHDHGPEDAYSGSVEALVPPAVAWAQRHGDGPVLVESDGGLISIPSAMVLGLDRAGQDVVVDGGLATLLPDYRHRDVEPTTTLIVAGPEAASRLDSVRGAVRLAEDPGDPSTGERPALAVFALPAT